MCGGIIETNQQTKDVSSPAEAKISVRATRVTEISAVIVYQKIDDRWLTIQLITHFTIQQGPTRPDSNQGDPSGSKDDRSQNKKTEGIRYLIRLSMSRTGEVTKAQSLSPIIRPRPQMCVITSVGSLQPKEGQVGSHRSECSGP